ncbi:hypothetical protein IMZ48_44145, partial [Candidatus Bathyarchaeota archaeon]|nr:hypothetical protein [Candidatus Bathyarchaeota archaeon]
IDRQLKVSSSGIKISLELAENAAEVSRAVDAYIDARVSELDLLQDELSVQVRDALRQKANGTFLWVALVFEELQQVNGWDVLQVVEELPMDLGKLYDRMVSQIQKLGRNDPEYCRLTLSVVALASRPLCLAELGVLSGLPNAIMDNVEHIKSIVALCGSFLAIQDDVVHLIHQSAHDFLVGKEDSGKPMGSIFPSGTGNVHYGIFSRSLRAMKSVLRRNIYDLDDPGLSSAEIKTPDPDPLAPIRYSIIHWVYHFREAYSSPECATECVWDLSDDGSVLGFFSNCFLYWLESLCLLRMSSLGVTMVTIVLRIVQVCLSNNNNLQGTNLS